jgi:hypothetical protein
MKKLFAMILISVFLVACAPNVPVKVFSAGKIISANRVATSFNESIKMQLVTEKYIIVVKGNHSIEIGSDTLINKYSNGSECIVVGGSSDCWTIYP